MYPATSDSARLNGMIQYSPIATSINGKIKISGTKLFHLTRSGYVCVCVLTHTHTHTNTHSLSLSLYPFAWSLSVCLSLSCQQILQGEFQVRHDYVNAYLINVQIAVHTISKALRWRDSNSPRSGRTLLKTESPTELVSWESAVVRNPPLTPNPQPPAPQPQPPNPPATEQTDRIVRVDFHSAVDEIQQ